MNLQKQNLSPRIAALCATPRYMNTGMRCVDQSLHELLKSLNLLRNTEFFCFDLPDYSKADRNTVSYKSIYEMKPYTEYEIVLLWGDFIVTKKWIDRICKIMSAGKKVPKADVRKLVEDRVLLKGCTDDIFKKTIVFGQSLMVDDGSIFDDSKYFQLFRNLLQKVKLARFRDPLSAYRAGIISGKPVGEFMGIDAALLLESFNEKIKYLKGEYPVIRENTGMESIGIFFGRTKKAKLTKLLIGMSLRWTHTRYELRWIPWLRERENPGYLLRKVFRLSISNRPSSIDEFIQELRASIFIVTDTYHMSLMAWSCGIPSVCIGNGLQNFSKTIDDKKKELFYSQNYLTEFYIYNENSMKDFLKGRMAKAFRLASEKNIGEETRKRIASVAKENIDALKLAIQEILK